MPPPLPAPDITRHLQTEARVAQLTLILGAAAALPVAYFHGAHWGAGILIGAILAWFNFRWLKQGLDALTESAADQSAPQKASVPIGAYFRASFRYLLIALAVYVIFKVLNVPVLSMIIGLCALGAAAFAISVQEILHPRD
jgi:small-conductance mechanosensitive channel